MKLCDEQVQEKRCD